jgi:hypothetical protein
VDTAVDVTTYGVSVSLGGPAGLSELSAPVALLTHLPLGVPSVTLDDRATPSGVHYVMTTSTVDADNGFGGLTHGYAAPLTILGAAAAGDIENVFSVSGVPSYDLILDGSDNHSTNVFDVDDTAYGNFHITMIGGAGTNKFNLAGMTTDMDIRGGTAANYVNVGFEHVVSNGFGEVRLSTSPSSPFDISIDDGSYTSADKWFLGTQLEWPNFAHLSLFTRSGEIIYAPEEVRSLTIISPSGQPNVATISLGNGNALPSAGSYPILKYFGGSIAGEKSDLVLLDDFLSERFLESETHLANSPGSGEIYFSTSEGPAGTIFYSGLSSDSLYDTVSVTNYLFNAPGILNGPIQVRDGVLDYDLTDYIQTLLIWSPVTSRVFTDTYLANKTNIAVKVGDGAKGVEASVDYVNPLPVAGLSTLTIATGARAGDGEFFTLPQGAVSNLIQGDDDDHAEVSLNGTAGATAANLDGGLGYDVLTIDAGGSAILPANFSVGSGGSTLISGSPTPGGPISYVDYEQVNVTNLPALPPAATASTLHGVRFRTLTDANVGSFTSAAPGAKPDDFKATIDWGDGSWSDGTIVQDASNPSTFRVMGTHTYGQGSPAYTTHLIVASAGSLLATTINGVPVTFSTPASDPVTAAGAAVIADSALTPSATQPVIPSATEGIRFTDVAVGAFEDLDPNPNLAGYIVTIDWGDGSPTSFGRVVQPGGPGTTLYVLGSHTFADSAPPGTSVIVPAIFPPFPLTYTGTFPVLIHVQDSGGSAATLSNTITVQDRPLSVSGGLDPSSDSGASSSDAITNVVQPTFRGRASEGGARISLYISGVASTESGDFPSSFSAGGAATADATGEWRITLDGLLPDGVYSVRAQAFDADGPTTSPATTIVERMVVDTVGPRVTGLVFDNRRGRVVAAFQDFGGAADAGVGLNFATIVDANNYRFAPALPATLGPRRAIRWIVGGVAVDPGTDDGAQAATITINGGRGFRGGRYLFRARSVEPANLTGVQDLAGNALDGEFYSVFPSGNNHVGGDFVAGLDAVHRRVFAPRTMIGAASPVTPPRLRSAGRITLQPGRSAPRRHTRPVAINCVIDCK